MALPKSAVEIGGIAGGTLPVSWLRAHEDRKLTFAALDLGRVMTNPIGPGPLAGQFEFLLEIAPLVLVRAPARVYGVSVSPLHMRWNFQRLGNRVRPFAEASGGIIFTSKDVPARTTVFNFLDQAGFGVRIDTASRRAVLVGYRFQHISNAGLNERNPGANFNFFYAGMMFLR